MCRIPSDFVIPLDPRLSFIEAATIPANYGTTYRMLFTNCDMQPNDLVLVLGASGGVGTATVQVVKAYGGRVIACAGTDEKCAQPEGDRRRPHDQLQRPTIFRAKPGASAEEGGRHLRQFHRGRYLESVDPHAQGARQLLHLRGDGGLRRADRHPLHLAAGGEDLRVERLYQGGCDARHGRYGGRQDQDAARSHVPARPARGGRSRHGSTRLLRQDRYDP